MNLPNAESAVIDRLKIRDYLLNSAHPDNGGKARFFADLGFLRDDWRTLADAFRQLVIATPVALYVESTHGRKYIVEGPIYTPSGKMPRIRTVWIIDAGGQTPRLVTAYPHE